MWPLRGYGRCGLAPLRVANPQRPYPSAALAGINIPDGLVSSLVQIDSVAPNTWNPNNMDSFMREKLVRSIRRDGFIMPILVRPMTRKDQLESGVSWEIVDGEHRYRVAKEELAMPEVPIFNLGPVSDSQAKEITIKANTLRGEFDSVKLAGVLQDLINDIGKQEVIDNLPFTIERIDALIAVNSGNIDDLLKQGAPAPGAPNGEGSGAEFKAFNPDTPTFEHKCPRCAFEFNSPKSAE